MTSRRLVAPASFAVPALATMLGLAVGACAAPTESELGVRSDAIVNGTLGGPAEVVFLYRLDGAACTGAIISPRVVLTANHCVEVRDGVPAPAANFRIYVGSSTRSLTVEYLVSEVRAVPGAGLGAGEPNDVALLVLSQPARETPMNISRADPRTLIGQPVTAIGFGQTPTGGSGTKYTTTTTIQGVQDGFVFVDPSVCSGDSGGPLVASDGLIYGVASFIYSPDGRTEPRCGTAPGAYNEIYRHIEFIDGVLEETGSCIGDGEERCDGGDNDCDDMVDEGCLALGTACSADSECTGGLCGETEIGRVCTAPCDPLRPGQGCSPGSYCAGTGCEGFCVPGLPGAARLEADCTADTDCHSLFCLDPGDGRRRCLDPCRGGEGLCLAGEVCAASVGACGGCVPSEIVQAGRAMGEPCAVDTDCAGAAVCHEVEGIFECAPPCTGATEDECGEAFHCRDLLCVRDRTQGVGGVCAENPDCGDMGICASQGGRSWCTATCTGGASGCPSGFDCVAAGGAMVCAPASALDGETCAVNEDCASAICATLGGAGRVCTSFCDARTACAPGFECRRTDGLGQNVCVVPAVEARDGCSAAAPGRGGSVAALPAALLGLLGLVVASRRRRARGAPSQS